MSILESKEILVLSPHPDDAVLSCGGLLAKRPGQVLTVFCADPPVPRPAPLARAFADPATRRAEDAHALDMLSCTHESMEYPDAIDRVHEGQRVYQTIDSLFGVLVASDIPLVATLSEQLAERLGSRILVCPLAVGAHVDHQICAHLGRRLQQAGHTVWFYQDAPYVFPDPGPRIQGDTVLRAAMRMRARVRAVEDVVIERGPKEAALACYSSQIAALFGDMSGYRDLATRHYESLGGEIERFHSLAW